MAKASAGGEIDSWCTKCRMVLNHRVIAMVGPKPVKVECSTCGSHHNFRAKAPGEKADPVAGGVKRGANDPRPARVGRVTKAEQARQDQELSWEKAVSGHGVNEFKKYNVGGTFAEGDLIKHTKFGDGVVLRVIDAGKVEVLFRDEPRTLAQGMT
ncbi:MAG: hypothetical protein JWM74_4950 [Myxococcaceae bacterium]|nr:hypothetical protein [Myxococcaceae bacterium]